MKNNMQQLSQNEKIARVSRYVLLAAIALVFVLFFLVGYDRPYAENPNFREPALTGTVVTFVILVLCITLGATLWSVARTVRIRSRETAAYNGIPARKIMACVAAATLFMLAITWMMGTTQPVKVNGDNFNNSFWLKTADMFVWSIIILLATAIAAILYSSWQSRKND